MTSFKVLLMFLSGFVIGNLSLFLAGWDFHTWQYWLITLPFCVYVGWSIA